MTDRPNASSEDAFPDSEGDNPAEDYSQGNDTRPRVKSVLGSEQAISRKQFLRLAASTAGAAAVALGVWKGPDILNALEEDRKRVWEKNTRHAVAHIVSKEHIPARIAPVIAGIAKPERWVIKLSIENEPDRVLYADVSAEDFESYKTGERVTATYYVGRLSQSVLIKKAPDKQ